MIYYRCLVLSLMALALSGCSRIKAIRENVDWPLVGPDLCANREVGRLYIDKSEIQPLNIRPGEAFTHRLKCTYCNAPNKRSVQVELIRRVVFDGRVMKEKLELQNVDSGSNKFSAEIKVAEGAKPGIYFLDTTIPLGDKTINHRDRFNVTEK